MKENQQFIKAAIASVIIAAIFCILYILTIESAGSFMAKLSSIGFSLIFFGITGVISLVVTEKPEYKGLGTAGAIVSGLSFLMATILTLSDGDGMGESMGEFTLSLFIASIALAHISLLHHFNLQNKYAHTARTTATVFISIFSLIFIVLIFGGLDEIQSTFMRNGTTTIKLIMSALVIDLAATLLVPLCNRLKVDEPVEFSFTNEEQQQPAAPVPPVEPVQPMQQAEQQATGSSESNPGA